MTSMETKEIFRVSPKTVLFSGAACLAMSFGLATSAVAQETEAPEEAERTLEAVVVTARNREESIQDVPLAITAFDEDSFRRKNIENLDDIARLTAGLSFEDFSGGFDTPVIRGQTQTRLTALEPNVSVFLDGVYIPRSWAIDVGTSNLERIEIVKGPQSARYGRNAFAGAINYVPFKATISDQPVSGQLTGTVGSDERFDGGVRANLSIGGIAAIAGSFNFSTFDGSFDNAHPFADIDLPLGTSGNAGGFENNSFSVSAVVKPIERLTLDFSINNFDVENEARAGANLSQAGGDLNCGNSVFFSSRLFCGDLPSPPEDAITDPRSFGVVAETDIIRAGATLDLSDDVTVSYVFGSVNGDVLAAGSSESDQIGCGLLPFAPFSCAFTAAPVGGIDYISHEIRAVYDNSSNLRFELGVFASDGEDLFTTVFPLAPNFDGVTDGSTIMPITDFIDLDNPAASDFTETDVWAVFGAAQWTGLEGRLRLGAELRYSENTISSTALTATVPDTLRETFGFFTPRITVDYDLTGDTLIYASAARGAKAGGFNPSATLVEDQTFDEEINWTYEIGIKNQLFGNRLTLNGAAFFTDWSDLQINGPDTGSLNPLATSIVSNLGDARVFGIELESALLVTDNLSLDATFSWTDNRYRDGSFDQRFAQLSGFGFPPVASCDDIVCSSDGDIGGNRIERTPPIQVSGGAQWEAPLPVWNGGSYFLRTDLSWQSDFFASPINLATIPDRFLLGASAGFNFDNIEFSVWGRNLTDENFVSNSFVIIAPFGNQFNTFFGDRRTFGATVKLKY